MAMFTEVAMTAGPIVVFLFIAYPIIVLIILLRPTIAAAFRGEAPEPPEQDYYDTPPEGDRDWRDDRDRPDEHFRPADQ
jgi:hypothetical protein